MEQYTKSFKEHEEMLAKYKLDISAKFDQLNYELSRRVSNEDLKLNMDALNDMLMLKFE